MSPEEIDAEMAKLNTELANIHKRIDYLITQKNLVRESRVTLSKAQTDLGSIKVEVDSLLKVEIASK